MPCDSIITHSVQLNNVAQDRVLDALRALGAQGQLGYFYYRGKQWSLRNGILSVSGSRYAGQDLKQLAGEVADEIRRMVGFQAVQEAAQANGWAFEMDAVTQEITLSRQSGGF